MPLPLKGGNTRAQIKDLFTGHIRFETLHPEPEGWLNSLLLNFSCPLKSKFCSNDSNNLVDYSGCSSSAAAGL